MPISKQELKSRALASIDQHRDKIMNIGDSIYAEPELGYKEFKTAEKVKQVFKSLNIPYRDEVAITGVIGSAKGKSDKLKVAVMGELDAIISPSHPDADKNTGAAHACGHNCQIASMIGAAYGLTASGIMSELAGEVAFMAVPAEEFVEIEYRDGLIQDGRISFIGGKQEFIKLGEFDDVDFMIMQHAGMGGATACAGLKTNGFIGKMIRYIGKSSHAGAAPHLGINALNAANIGLAAVNYQRETFQDKDNIRVHPIITKGGDLVNVVPDDVRIETYIRGNNVTAILDADFKVSRAFKAGGDAVGAQTVIKDFPGYLPFHMCPPLMDVMYGNLVKLIGDEAIQIGEPLAGSTDAGDVSVILPTLHAGFGGVTGVLHGADMRIADKELVYITAAKSLAMTVIDLLYHEGETGQTIKAGFVPLMSKEEYLSGWGKLK